MQPTTIRIGSYIDEGIGIRHQPTNQPRNQSSTIRIGSIRIDFVCGGLPVQKKKKNKKKKTIFFPSRGHVVDKRLIISTQAESRKGEESSQKYTPPTGDRRSGDWGGDGGGDGGGK
jgi:hypothetical protein